jgi:hypothetical protein
MYIAHLAHRNISEGFSKQQQDLSESEVVVAVKSELKVSHSYQGN